MNMRRFLIFVFIFLTAFLLIAAGDPPPASTPVGLKNELSAALARRLETKAATQALTIGLFTPELDTAFTTPDGKTAVMWLALRDDRGQILATEPGLALAHLSAEGWEVLLPGDPGWDETLASLPDDMLPLELSPAPAGASLTSGSIDALSGYYLPYAAGTARWLEGSISHFQYIPELGYPSCTIDFCHYAYDFTDLWHFPLLASKDGTVFASRDSCPDGGTNCTNFIVLFNAGDHAYQIYLHMSQGTIPDKLSNGTQVKRGQYLGDTDDTGYSTSQHVHFMVTNSVWQGGDGYYWGQSINIHFADVAINNGIPRTCYEVTHFAIYDGASECLGNKSDPRNPANDWYVSGNQGAYPPTGSLSRPAEGAVVNSGSNPVIDVTATVTDDVKVTAVSLVANINGQWVEVGPKLSQPTQGNIYDWDVDLCAAGPLNGPLQVALRAWDYEGNVSEALSPRDIQVDHACPPPTSQLKPAKTYNSTAVYLTWEATDAGAGLGSFELQWRTEPGTWNAASTITVSGSQRSTWFTGDPGVTYTFRLRALDVNGQAESWPAGDVAETSAVLPASCTPDLYEKDDTSVQARAVALSDQAVRNLCGAANPDWFEVKVEQVKDYMVSVASQNGGAAVKITVYSGDGVTVVANAASPGIGRNAFVIFKPEAAGTYYVRIEPLSSKLFGTDAVYAVSVNEVKLVYLPYIDR